MYDPLAGQWGLIGGLNMSSRYPQNTQLGYPPAGVMGMENVGMANVGIGQQFAASGGVPGTPGSFVAQGTSVGA